MPRPRSDGTYRTSPDATPVMQSVPPLPNGKAEAQPVASESSGVFSETQFDVLASIIGETQILAEKQLRAAITSLREESEIQVGLVREEVMGRMDSKLFGSTLVDDAGEIAKKAVRELRIEIDKRDESTSTRLDSVNVTLDRIERDARKRELESWRGVVAQVARNHARIKDVEGKVNAITEKLDALGVELRELRHALGDEATVPWTPLALPAPA